MLTPLLLLLSLTACTRALEPSTTLLVGDRLSRKAWRGMSKQGGSLTVIKTRLKLDVKSSPGSQASMVYNSTYGSLAVGLTMQNNGLLMVTCEGGEHGSITKKGSASAGNFTAKYQEKIKKHGIEVRFEVHPSKIFRGLLYVMASVRYKGSSTERIPECYFGTKQTLWWSFQAQLRSSHQWARMTFTPPSLFDDLPGVRMTDPLVMSQPQTLNESPSLKWSAGHNETIDKYEIVHDWQDPTPSASVLTSE